MSNLWVNVGCKFSFNESVSIFVNNLLRNKLAYFYHGMKGKQNVNMA